MANSFSLSNAGSMPQQNTNSNYAKNISGIQVGQAIPGSTKPSGLIGGGATGNDPVMTNPAPKVTPGLIPTPSTPVKSVTHNAADGSSTTTAFHAPATESSNGSSMPPAPSAGIYSSTTGKTSGGLTPQQVSQGYSTVPGLYNPVTGQPNAQQQASPAAQQPEQNSLQSAVQSVKDASGMTPEEQYYNNMAISGKELSNHNALDPYAEQGFYNGTNGAQLGVDLKAPDLQGRASGEAALSSGVGNIFGSAASTGYANALQQQQLALGGAENVLSASQPASQFGQLTDPLTGRVIGASATGNNPALDSAIQNTLQLIQNGTPQDQAISASGLSNFGAAGTTALTNAQLGTNSGYNPSAQSTAANTNLANAATTQQQAYTLDTNLKSFDNVGSIATNFLTSNSLLNPTDNPNYNEAIGKYVSTIQNPAAASQYALIVGDVKNLQSSILASYGAQTPTGVTAQVLQTDPSTLSAPQLNSWLSSLKQLGDSQLSVLQNQTNTAYKAPTAYSGTPTKADTQTATTPNANGAKITPGLVGKAAIGTGLGLVGGIEDVLGKAISWIKGVS